MKKILAMMAVAGLVAATGAWADGAVTGDPAKAQQLVTSVCAACHGADGNASNPTYPKLAAQPDAYIAKQLADFKKGARKNPIMNGIAAGLKPADMANLGAYFNGQAAKPGTAKLTPEMAALAQKLYRSGDAEAGVPACMACHGPSGAGIPGLFPRLSGQNAEYTLAQLKAFHDGTRANDPNGTMRAIAGKLSDQDMQALAQYVAGLH